MTYIIAGLGNPSEEYEDTRHNTGRSMVYVLAREYKAPDFEFDKKINAKISEIKIKKEKVTFILPETFMNKSGNAILKVVKSVKAAEKLIVIYDDFNLPLGALRISFNRSSGGHNGLESIIKAIKTQAFLRIRVGVSPSNAKGIAKIPHGEDKIEKFILGKFKPDEVKDLGKIAKRVIEAVELIVNEGKDKAMSMVNAG
ncbi:MAG TPA: aminoacyl-tRNA hydrolase [Candidatus Paceibacterota bacterium]